MSIETMKQALEALNCINSPLHVREMRKLGEAMKILRQAIEQAEKQAEKQKAQCIRPPGKSWLTVNPEGNIELRKTK